MKNPILTTSDEVSTVSNDLMNFTLRDHFAGLAMQSVMTGEDYKHVKTVEDYAKWSYAVADAMLKERESKKQ